MWAEADRELITIREAAAWLRVGTPSALRWIREEGLPAARVGKFYRIRRSDLTAWYESRRKVDVLR